MTKVCIIGSGAWGSALACVSARAGHDTVIWGRSDTTVCEINSSHKNSHYLEGLVLEKTISATTNIEEALRGADLVLLSIPTQMLASRLEEVKRYIGDAIVVTCCKGIDQKTGKLPTELVAEIVLDNQVGVLSGPSFASDVVSNLPTAVTVASANEATADVLANLLSTETFRCYAATDIKGVELGGALKNVLALAVGAARGMGLGASAEAALMTRGFVELRRLASALGARPDTLTGLSGLGDLVLTCSSPQSRNFAYGMAMGAGESLEGLKLAEGANTAGVAHKIAQAHKIDVPIIAAVVAVLENRVTAREAVEGLLTRPLKREN